MAPTQIPTVRRILSRIEPAPVVAVVRLSGIIGELGGLRRGITLHGIARQLQHAFDGWRVRAVALSINSPGGSAVQSAVIHRRIRLLAAEKQVQVFSFCEDVAASGGYMLACAADEVYADPSSIIGSIGVVAASFGFQELLARWGIERRVHVAGDRKAMLDPFRPERAEDVAHLESLQREVHEDFKQLVRERRGDRLRASEDELFSGAFWSGRRALDMGLIDGLGDMRSVMRERFGDKVQLRLVNPERFPWSGLVSGDGAEGKLAQRLAGGAVRAVTGLLEERSAWARFGL